MINAKTSNVIIRKMCPAKEVVHTMPKVHNNIKTENHRSLTTNKPQMNMGIVTQLEVKLYIMNSNQSITHLPLRRNKTCNEI